MLPPSEHTWRQGQAPVHCHSLNRVWPPWERRCFVRWVAMHAYSVIMVWSQIVGALEEAAHWGRAGKLTKVPCFSEKGMSFILQLDVAVGTATISVQIIRWKTDSDKHDICYNWRLTIYSKCLVGYKLHGWSSVHVWPIWKLIIKLRFDRAFGLISAMELALALEKLVNEKLHNLHAVSCFDIAYLPRDVVWLGLRNATS
jgi:hypothetical protein